MEIDGKIIEIITGRYGQGTPEENKRVDVIFGGKAGKERFALYFHWYNLIHELGHGILHFNDFVCPHPVQEEQLVNDFAVAFWRFYGEEAKFGALKKIVAEALDNLHCPADPGVSHVAYAFEKWGTEDLLNFNNYGWFQFCCVKNSLLESKTLESVLTKMGVENIRVQPSIELHHSLTEEASALRIVQDAIRVLRAWGARIPDAVVTFDNDPNRHMCKIVEIRHTK